MTPYEIGTWVGVVILLLAVAGTLWFIYKYRPILSLIKRSDKALTWILASFDTSNSEGASARKLSAAWAMLILATPPQIAWIVWACKHNDFSLLPTILTLDFGYAAAALGMTTYSAIQGKKIDNKADLANKVEDNTSDLGNKIVDKQ